MEHALKKDAIARAQAQRAALRAEAEEAAKAELARRRAADVEDKRESERRRALLAAQQKRLADQERANREAAKRRKREAEMDESDLPDIDRAMSAARALATAKKPNKSGAKGTSHSGGSGSASSIGKDGSSKGDQGVAAGKSKSGPGLMATFDSVVKKAARRGAASEPLLTRAEKRERKFIASLGGEKRSTSRSASLGSARASSSHSPARQSWSTLHNTGHPASSPLKPGQSVNTAAATSGSDKGQSLPSFSRKAGVIGIQKAFDEAITLGQQKRDKRSIDEVERDMRAAKEAKLLEQGGTSEATMEQQKRREEEQRQQEEKRRIAMARKRNMDLAAKGLSEPSAETGSQNSDLSQPLRQVKNASPVVNQRLLAAAEFYGRKVSPTPPQSSSGPSNGTKKSAKNAHKKGGLSKHHDADNGREGSTSIRGGSPGRSEAAVPRKKETERERFIRLEAERKKERAKSHDSASKHDRYSLARRSSDPEDEYDSADSFVVNDADEEDDGDASTQSDDVDDDARTRKKRKLSNSPSSHRRDSARQSKQSVSEQIWQLFGRDRSKYVGMDDSDDDMEATAADIAREEMKSARIARKEDQREQEAEERRAREKAARLKAARLRSS